MCDSGTASKTLSKVHAKIKWDHHIFLRRQTEGRVPLASAVVLTWGLRGTWGKEVREVHSATIGERNVALGQRVGGGAGGGGWQPCEVVALECHGTLSVSVKGAYDILSDDLPLIFGCRVHLAPLRGSLHQATTFASHGGTGWGRGGISRRSQCVGRGGGLTVPEVHGK